jgi:D-sedoheptulose 7-phosphate isomerase
VTHHVSGYDRVRRLAETLVRDCDEIVGTAERWGRELCRPLSEGARLVAAGNGGSAAEAQHLCAEIVGRFEDDRPPFSAIALCAETSSMTAIANDFGADEMFARQVRAHGRAGDQLVLLSTSGRSPNVLAAARAGHEKGMSVRAMTGPAPNPLADLADDVLAVNCPATSTVQEIHLLAVHVMCAAFDAELASPARPRTVDLREPAEVLP